MSQCFRTAGMLLRALAAFVFVTSSAVYGAGGEFSRSAADLVVTVDGRWAGCGSGGYYPLRIKVANRGLQRDLTFQFSRQGDEKVPTARRAIRLGQNATARLTVSVPCVGDGSYGALKVYEDGRLIDDLTQTLTLPGSQQHSPPRPAMLVISQANEDLGPFETAVTSTVSTSHMTSAPFSYGYVSVNSEDHQVVGPEMLPESWLDYSGLDFAALSLPMLGSLSAEARTAVLKWVHCGGTLIVYDVGEPAARSQQLARLLQLDQHAAVSPTWEPANLSRRKPIVIVQTDGYGNVISGGETLAGESPAAMTEPPSEFDWPAANDTFASRELVLGNVYAFPANPFPGTPHDWGWFLSSVPPQQKTWAMRHGIAARWGSDEFLKFLIPAVKGVPVFAFLFLITVFTVVIGPLNYLWLWKKRRLYVLVLTIPAIALGTSLVLFAYSAIAHGFSTKSRARSLTFIDQRNNSAVSLARIALYSGLAPSDGLQFSPESAVYPIWPQESSFGSGTVDWTDQQQLIGWLRSRTRTQFLTVSHRDERGRLIVSSPGPGRLRVENGLEWPLDALVVSDEKGQLFYGTKLAAGDAAELSPIDDEQRADFSELLKQYPLVPPQTSGGNSGIFNWDLAMRYMYRGSTPVRFESGLLEQHLRRLQRIATAGSDIDLQSYVAVVGENPGIDLGVDRTRPEVSLHVLMGRY